MNKAAVVDKISADQGITKKLAGEIFDQIFTTIGQALAEGTPVTIPSFGTFKIGERAARAGRNPQTGEAIEVAASRVVSFKSAKSLKALVNN